MHGYYVLFGQLSSFMNFLCLVHSSSGAGHGSVSTCPASNGAMGPTQPGIPGHRKELSSLPCGLQGNGWQGWEASVALDGDGKYQSDFFPSVSQAKPGFEPRQRVLQSWCS